MWIRGGRKGKRLLKKEDDSKKERDSKIYHL
jgi:hypothetical protein